MRHELIIESRATGPRLKHLVHNLHVLFLDLARLRLFDRLLFNDSFELVFEVVDLYALVCVQGDVVDGVVFQLDPLLDVIIGLLIIVFFGSKQC